MRWDCLPIVSYAAPLPCSQEGPHTTVWPTYPRALASWIIHQERLWVHVETRTLMATPSSGLRRRSLIHRGGPGTNKQPTRKAVAGS